MTTLIIGYIVALAISTLVAVSLRVKLTPHNSTSKQILPSKNTLVLKRMDEIESLLRDTIAELEAHKNRNTTAKKDTSAGRFSEELNAT